jgi:hypothetical protein
MSANVSPPHENQEIKEKPAYEEQARRGNGQDECSSRTLAQSLERTVVREMLVVMNRISIVHSVALLTEYFELEAEQSKRLRLTYPARLDCVPVLSSGSPDRSFGSLSSTSEAE